MEKKSHIFVINSHTTFLTVLGIIDYLSLSKNDVLLLRVRNYDNDLTKYWDTIDTSKLCSECEVLLRKDLKRNLKIDYIKKVDDFVSTYFSNKYHLYAPHLAHPFWQVMYTNSKCTHFSYVQEGALPFTSAFQNKVPFWGKVKNLIFKIIGSERYWYYRPWFLKSKIKKTSLVDSYSTNEAFFRYLPVPNYRIRWPEPTMDYSISLKNPHMIFIFDGFVSNMIMQLDDYLGECKKLIDKEAKTYNYLKFHPAQKRDEISTICEYFKQKNLHFEELESTKPFEYTIISNRDLNLTGFGSSLLYLAYEHGHNVTCYDYVLNKYILYRENRKRCGFMSFDEYVKNENTI